MRSAVFAAFVFAAFFFASMPVTAAPQAAYYYPCGVQAGTTNRIVVGGQGMWRLRGGWVSGSGVEVVRVVKVPGFPTQGGGEKEVAWVSEWLDGVWDGRMSKPLLPDFKALRTWRRCPWWDTLDERDDVELSIVARAIYVRQNPLQTSPALSQLVILDVAASPDATPGLRDIVLYADNGVTAPHPFFVTSEPHAAEQRFAPPSKVKDDERVFNPPIVLDGQIMPGETDSFQLNLPKGRRLVCTLVGRELQPYIGDAVPGFFNPVMRLVDADGHAIATADDFHFLPDPVMECIVPADGVYRLEVHDNLFRGRADFVYAVKCLLDDGENPLPVPQTRAFYCFPQPASHMTPSPEGSRTFKGTIDFPGRSVAHDFEVTSPSEYTFDLFARRRGSPLDGVMKLYGPVTFLPQSMTPFLARWDDVTNKVHVGSIPQVESDPRGTWRFEKPGKYRIAVADSGGSGGPGFDYELNMAPSAPSFAAYSSRSSFLLGSGKGARVSFKVIVVRSGGFAGAVRLQDTDNFTFEKREIPAGSDVAEVVAVSRRPRDPGMLLADFTATAEISPGKTITLPVVPTDEVQQAFAYTHRLPARHFCFYTLKHIPPSTEMPEWIPMPADKLFPKKIILPTAEFAKKSNAAALDAVCEVDTVPIAYIPTDADDSILAVKFASSAAHVQNVREVVAREPSNGKVDAAAYARSVAAGITRLIAGGLRHADGEPRRVRAFARAAATPSDNDVLLYVPSDEASPLSGPVGAVARRLRDEGWCFDFVTDKTFALLPPRTRYRVVYVPKMRKPMPDETFKLMAAAAEKSGMTLLFEDALPPAAKELGIIIRSSRGDTVKHGRGKIAVGPSAYLLKNEIARAARREPFASLGRLRFARYGGNARDGWYFIYNPTKREVSGDWSFAFRARAKMAVAMEVDTGRIEILQKKKKKNTFAYTLKGGASVWICVTTRDLTAPKQNEGGRPGHGGGRACNSCHDAPVKR